MSLRVFAAFLAKRSNMDGESLPWILELYEGISCFMFYSLYVEMQFNWKKNELLAMRLKDQ